MDIYHVKDGKPEKIPKDEFGNFFVDDIYIIDLIGKKHRYVVTWMGPKLNPLEIS